MTKKSAQLAWKRSKMEAGDNFELTAQRMALRFDAGQANVGDDPFQIGQHEFQRFRPLLFGISADSKSGEIEKFRIG